MIFCIPVLSCVKIALSWPAVELLLELMVVSFTASCYAILLLLFYFNGNKIT